MLGSLFAGIVASLGGSIAKDMIGPIIGQAVAKVVSPGAAGVVTEAITEAVANDPVLQNQMNAEPIYKSRVIWGAIAVLLPALGGMAGLFAAGDYDLTRWWPFVSAAGGAVYTIYGRLTGKAALFSRA